MIARMLNDFAPLFRLHDEMTRRMDGFLGGDAAAPAPRSYGSAYPALNTWEDGDNAWIEAELPGLGLDDIEVLVNGGEVTINGQRKPAEPQQQGATWHRRERSHGRFSRTLTLPWDVNADKVQATLRDGVLTVQLPRAESAKPRKVKVLTA